MSDEKYKYSYYLSLYEKDVVETTKKNLRKAPSSPANVHYAMDEEPYIYIQFMINLGIKSFDDLDYIAKTLDEQTMYADDKLKACVQNMFHRILEISDAGGDVNDLKKEIYTPVDPQTYRKYS